MDISIPWAVVGPWTGWAAFLSVCWYLIRAVQTGEWIPRRTHDRELAQAREIAERAQHDAGEWRAEGRIKDAQLAEKDKQLSHMGEVGRTVDAIMRALQEAATKGSNGGRRSG